MLYWSTFAKEQTLVEQIHVNGKCHCGNISISGSFDANMIIACHCTDCQTFSGAPYRAVVIMTRENITIDGEVSEYTKVADSGNERVQGFCGVCGTQVYARAPDRSVYNVRTGFLEQHKSLAPVKHIFAKSKAPWINAIEDAVWHDAGPASKQV